MVAELSEEGLVQKVLNVLRIVEGGGGGRRFGGFALVAGLARVDSCTLGLRINKIKQLELTVTNL